MQMIIPDDWDNESFCRWSVCWPNSVKWKAILSGLLEQPAQGRFWDFKTGNFLETRGAFFPAYTYNFDLKEVIVSCNDVGLTEIAAALRSISISLSNQATATANCCANGQGTGGAGGTTPPFDPIEVTDPGEGDPPEGFETWEQYFANKCAVATYYVDIWIDDVGRMRIINLVGLTITSLIPVLIGLLLDPIPGDEIAVLGAYLLTALAAGAGALDAFEDVITAAREDLICALYQAQTPASAESSVETAFAEAWDNSSHSGDPWGFAIKGAFGAMVTSVVTNKLFTLQTDLELPEGDCSDCGQGFLWHFDENSMDWTWEQLEGGTSTPGAWDDGTACGEGALVDRVMTASGPTYRSHWTLVDVVNVSGTTFAVDLVPVVAVDLKLTVTYFDDDTDEHTFTSAFAGEHSFTILNKNIKELDVEIAFSSGNPSFDFNVCINAVEIR